MHTFRFGAHTCFHSLAQLCLGGAVPPRVARALTPATAHAPPRARRLAAQSERAFARLEIVQNNLLSAVAFGTFLNAALALSGAAAAGAPLPLAARACWALAGAFGLRLPLGALRLKKEDKKLRTCECAHSL
jgi:hypothetical protein